MKFILNLLVLYICIIIVQMFYIKYATDIKDLKHEANVKFNRENEEQLLNFFKNTLTERLNLLKTKKMSYHEWIDYNKEHVLAEYDNAHQYYIFIFEVLPNHNYIQRVSANDNLVDVSWDDILKVNNEKLIYTKYATDKSLIQNFYDISSINDFNEIKYYWLDPLTTRSVSKQSIVARWDDKESGKTGVIGMGLDLEYIDENNIFFYFKEMGYGPAALISLLTFIISVVLYKLKGEKNQNSKAIIFLLLTNIYLMYFLGKYELYGSNDMENKKQENINSGILSVSFLVGVNIFILTALQKAIKKHLFTESGVVFGVSLILLLIATLKNTNFMSSSDVLKSRLTTQLIFNFAIILNILIIINYIMYILSFKLTHLKMSL